MQHTAVSALRELSAELDFFTNSAAVSRELLELDLYPPLPVSPSCLIWGFHILKEAEKAGKDKLACRLLPDPTPPAMLRLALHLESRAGRYSWLEQEACLDFLARRAPAVSPAELAQLLSGKSDPRLPGRIAAFSGLEPFRKKLVADGLLDLKSALRLRFLPDSVFRRLAETAGGLTFSQRRLLLSRLEEIGRREKLKETELLQLLADALPTADPPETLRRRRYPMLTGLEERFHSLEHAVLEKSGIRLEAPHCFEGEDFTVSFSFRSRAGLARKIGRLRALEDQSDELFSLLR
jgi:hypothetical protein